MTYRDRTYTRTELDRLLRASFSVVSSPVVADFDYGDLWGSTMGLAFDIADVLYYRDEDIPEDWKYRRGSPLNDLDEITHTELIESEPDYLRYLGNRAMELRDVLKDLGFDY